MSEQIRVLIVDDQPRARQSLKTLLGTCPQVKEVKEAGLAREAMRMMEESQLDVVLMDVQMPEMNGLEMIDRLRQDPVLSSIPVVIISTDGSLNRMAEARDKGVLAYLRKPFTPEQLKILLAQTLGITHG